MLYLLLRWLDRRRAASARRERVRQIDAIRASGRRAGICLERPGVVVDLGPAR